MHRKDPLWSALQTPFGIPDILLKIASFVVLPILDKKARPCPWIPLSHTNRPRKSPAERPAPAAFVPWRNSSRPPRRLSHPWTTSSDNKKKNRRNVRRACRSDSRSSLQTAPHSRAANKAALLFSEPQVSFFQHPEWSPRSVLVADLAVR